MLGEINQEILKEYFDYRNGFLYWKKKTSNFSRNEIGDIASHLNKNKNKKDLYNSTNFRNKKYRSARLIFCWHYGYFPQTIDHKNINSLDDRIENLRDATHSQNQKNRRSLNGSTSKYLGVNSFNSIQSWTRKDGTFVMKFYPSKWQAIIRVNGKNKLLGIFESEEDAALAYNKAAKIYHQEFANLNIIEDNKLTLSA